VDGSAIGTIQVRGGVTLRASPAREPSLRVVTDQAHMAHPEEGSPEHRREILHGDVHEEIQSLEIAAQNLVDFPDAPWELRLQLARQCWDEVRHARTFLRRLRDLGGFRGEFPVIDQEWGLVCMFDSLPGRLAVQNRVFEAGSLDVLKQASDVTRRWGDDVTADVIDAILPDEIQHVRFGNEWLARLRAENPRALLQAVSAMSAARAWIRALVPAGEATGHDVPENTEDRRDAGFDLA
jgi:uncharacterized ferritin-like protein (DUF455 family)